MKVCINQINCIDIESAKEFYCEKLGFTVKNDRGVVELNHEGSILLLYPVKTAVSVDYPNQTGVQLVFEVENIKQTRDDLQEKGVEVISDICTCPYGQYFAIKDSSGNVLELIQRS